MKDFNLLQQQMRKFVDNMPIMKTNANWVNFALLPMAELAYTRAKERGLDCDSVYYAVMFRQLKKLENSGDRLSVFQFINRDIDFASFDIENPDAIIDIIMAYTKRSNTPEAQCLRDAHLALEYDLINKRINSKGNSSSISKTLYSRFENMKESFEFASEEYKKLYSQKIANLEKILLSKKLDNSDKGVLKPYAVTVKCGHVGTGNYIPITFVVNAYSKKEAASSGLAMPRVKRNAPNAVLKVQEISYKQSMKIARKNERNYYLLAKNKSEHKRLYPFFKRHIVKAEEDFSLPKLHSLSETVHHKKTYNETYGIRNKKKFSKFHDEPAFDVTEEEINEAIAKGLA